MATTPDRASRVFPQTDKVRVLLDTDTYNEVDDQFAVAHALLSPERMDVQAICAAPFTNQRSTGPADGMEKSYDEILRLYDRLGMDPDGVVFRGSTRYLPDARTPVESPAAERLCELAHAAEEPLYVLAIGAITNVASALLMDPSLVDRIVVVWLGGQPLYWPTAEEFNLRQDLPAVRVVLDSGVGMVLIPCQSVASHLQTTVPELEAHIAGAGAIGEFLVQRVREHNEDHFAWSKVIWDIAATGWLIQPDWVPVAPEPAPILTDEMTWQRDPGRHTIQVARQVRRNDIFRDVFTKLLRHAAGGR